jgi:hypothetical protein
LAQAFWLAPRFDSAQLVQALKPVLHVFAQAWRACANMTPAKWAR